MRIDLGWAVYGDAGVKAHRWEFDQRLCLLRSSCRSIYRRTDNAGVLRADDAIPHCRNCTKKEKSA